MLEDLQRKAAAIILGVRYYMVSRTTLIDEAEIKPIRIRVLQRAAILGTKLNRLPDRHLLAKDWRKTISNKRETLYKLWWDNSLNNNTDKKTFKSLEYLRHLTFSSPLDLSVEALKMLQIHGET